MRRRRAAPGERILPMAQQRRGGLIVRVRPGVQERDDRGGRPAFENAARMHPGAADARAPRVLRASGEDDTAAGERAPRWRDAPPCLPARLASGPPPTGLHARSNRSRFITLVHAATKSLTNFASASLAP